MTEESTQWLTPLERAAWMRLFGVLQQLPAALDSQMRQCADLTLTEYYALAMLSDAPGQRIQTKQLAVFTNTTLSRLSRVISGLEQQELVQRVPNENDGRATDIQLTEAGMRRLAQAAPAHVDYVRRVVFAPQDAQGVEQLRQAMDRILNVLDPQQTLPRDPFDLPLANHPVDVPE